MLSRLIALVPLSTAHESVDLAGRNEPAETPAHAAALTPAGLGSLAVILALAGAGVWIMADRRGWHTDDEELAVMRFVRDTAKPGDVYFLPVSIPKLARDTRGSLSSDFKPLPDKQADKRVIPVNLQRFRLHAEAPIYVDFKSIPYLDIEVLQWHQRLAFAERTLARLKEADAAAALAELRSRGVTHLVLPAAFALDPQATEMLYQDTLYAVHRLKKKESAVAE